MIYCWIFYHLFIAFNVDFQFFALFSALEKCPHFFERQWLVKLNKVSSQRNENNLIGTLRWTADYTLWSMCSAWDKFSQQLTSFTRMAHSLSLLANVIPSKPALAKVPSKTITIFCGLHVLFSNMRGRVFVCIFNEGLSSSTYTSHVRNNSQRS